MGLPASYRAVIVRNRIDLQLIAVQTQHERLLMTPPELNDISNWDDVGQWQGLNDLDFFLTALRRLDRAADLARDGCDPTGALRQPIKLFKVRIAGVTEIRDVLEHFDDEDRRGRRLGLGIGMGATNWTITRGDNIVLSTDKLLVAAQEIHRAVRGVVDPQAATSPHGAPPMVRLQ